MTKLEKLYSIIENSREVGVKLNCTAEPILLCTHPHPPRIFIRRDCRSAAPAESVLCRRADGAAAQLRRSKRLSASPGGGGGRCIEVIERDGCRISTT